MIPFLNFLPLARKQPISYLASMIFLIAAFSLFAQPLRATQVDKIAILYVYPNDVATDAVYSKQDLVTHFDGPIKKFWEEQSYGRYHSETSIFVWQLPVGKDMTTAANGHYVVDMLNKVLPDGGNMILPGYKPTDYSKTIILLGGGLIGFGGGFGSADLKVNGQSYPDSRVGSFTYLHPQDKYYGDAMRFSYYQEGKPFQGNKNGETIKYPELGLKGEDGTLLHEWGHGIGLSTHANSWVSAQEPMYGDIYYWREKTFWKQMRDYGNSFDIMGGNPYWALHIHSFYKDLMNWYEAGEKAVVATSQEDIRVYPLESQKAGTVKCIQHPISAGKFSRPEPFDDDLDYAFYLEYRQPMGLDKHLEHEYVKSNTNGLLVYMTRRKEDGFVNSWLLDMSPDNVIRDKAPDFVATNDYVTEPDNHESSLNAGRTFYDEQTEFCVTNIRPQGKDGLLCDIQIGKKAGLTSGVYTSTLFPGESLTATGNPLHSADLSHYLSLDKAGFLLIKKSSDGRQIWKSTVAGDELKFEDGDLALFKNGTSVWNTNTAGHQDAKVLLGDDGVLRIYDRDEAVIYPKSTVAGSLIKAIDAPISISQSSEGIALSEKLTQSYTKEAWVAITPNNGRENNLISGRGSSQHAFWIPSGHGYRLSAGHNGAWGTVKAPDPFPSGRHHVAVTYDEASKTMKLYQDGVLVASAGNVAPVNNGDGFMQIGRYENAYNLVGELEHLKIWNYARSENDIQAGYQEHKDRDGNRLIKAIDGPVSIEQPDQGIALSEKLTRSYTKEAWVAITPNSGRENNLISGRGSSQHAFWIPSGHGYRLSAGHNGAWGLVKAPDPFPGGWHHVAVTYDEASKTMKLYQDGALVASAGNVAPVNSSDGFMQIGRYENAYNLVGDLKHAKIWNYARSDADILTAYRANREEIKIGDQWDGGIVFHIFQPGEKGYKAGETHGLICSMEDLGKYSFADAIEVCKAYQDGDWRLPEIHELSSAYQTMQEQGTVNFKEELYRSATSSGYASYPWALNFANGQKEGNGLGNLTNVRAIKNF